MKNGFVLLTVVVSLAGFAGMMRIKTDVQTLSRERLRLAKEQMELRETKRVLEAEWAHLANPLRLLKFAEARGYVPMGMQDVLVLAPAPGFGVAAPFEAVHGGTVWRRAAGKPVEEVHALDALAAQAEEAVSPSAPAPAFLSGGND